MDFQKTYSGDPSAYRKRADKYFDEDPKSKRASEWYLRGAEAGDAESQYMLGCLYSDGFGGLRYNYTEAEKWLIKAYRQGLMESLLEIARLMSKGHKIKDVAFDLQTEEDCYRKLIASDRTSDYFREKAQNRLNHLTGVYAQPVDVSSETPAVFNKKKKVDVNQDPETYLDHLIGLDTIKTQIKQVENVIAFNQKRKNAGLEAPNQSHHFAFIGNPGTGKTEVARIMGAIYKNMGILKSGHVVEVDRTQLVSEYIGTTPTKTMECIHRAIDGVLFIDEAHMLWNGRKGDFGLEAISTLVKAMEDYRDNLVVVFAGYTDPMEILLSTNAGLKSRIRHYMCFDDYTEQELIEIYIKLAHDSDFILHPDTEKAVIKLMKKALKYLDKDFGNGRYVRNCFDKTIEKMAGRIAQQDSMDEESLQTIMFMDVPTFEELQNKKSGKGKSGDNVINITD